MEEKKKISKVCLLSITGKNNECLCNSMYSCVIQLSHDPGCGETLYSKHLIIYNTISNKASYSSNPVLFAANIPS